MVAPPKGVGRARSEHLVNMEDLGEKKTKDGKNFPLSSSRILVGLVVIINPLTSQDLDYNSTNLVQARIP